MTTPTFPPVPGADQNRNLFLYPSGDPTGVQDATRINQAIGKLPASGGTINLYPGNWYLKPGTVVIAMTEFRPVQINGNGAFINCVGGASGDLIRFYGIFATSAANRSAITNLILDGSNCSANVTALHTGDLTMMKLDIIVQNFAQSGCIGINFDNTISWTEECDIRALVSNCTNAVIFQVTTGFESFGYNNCDFTIFDFGNQNGIQILNGAAFYHGNLRIRGNFAGSASALSNSVFSMQGAAPGGPNVGANTQCFGNRLEIQVECSAGAHAPITIAMDIIHFAFAFANYGVLDFTGGAGSFTPTTLTTGQFIYSGPINGDANLQESAGLWANVSQPVVLRVGPSLAGGVAPSTISDVVTLPQLSGNITIALTSASFNAGNTLGAAQRLTIKIQQAASGGPFTVTWPKPGSPSVSAPAVYWAGGTAPTMTATANATDIYNLVTMDGIHWYGQAIQNVS